MGLPDGESKQFLLLGGEPILNHSVRRLLAMPLVAGLVVVLHPSHTVRFASELPAFDDGKPLLIAEGGRTRTDSVRAGLMEVPSTATAIAVHDGARPLFSRRVLERCLGALDRVDGAVPGIEVSDTLKRANGDCLVQATVHRSGLWAARQTWGVCAAHSPLRSTVACTKQSPLARFSVSLTSMPGTAPSTRSRAPRQRSSTRRENKGRAPSCTAMAVAVDGTSMRPARTESVRVRPPSAISSGLPSSKAGSSLANRTVCEGCRTTTRPATSGMARRRRTE